MPKRLTFGCILVLVLGMIVDASAASTLKMTCSGELMNTGADGVTLGNCDLNFISVKQMDEIESVCGLPGIVDTPFEDEPGRRSAAIRRKIGSSAGSRPDHSFL